MEQRIARMQDLVRAVREVRNRYMVDTRTPLNLFVRSANGVASDFQLLAPFITILGGVGELKCGPGVQKPPQSVTHVHPEFEAHVSLSGLIDVEAEIKRLDKQLADKTKQLQGAQTKLNNSNFVDRAPADIVQQQRDLVTDLQCQIRVIEENLRGLQQE
jgi:valyl-tRNA synthetase